MPDQRRHSPELFIEGMFVHERHCQGLESRLCSLGLNIWASSVGTVKRRGQLGMDLWDPQMPSRQGSDGGAAGLEGQPEAAL